MNTVNDSDPVKTKLVLQCGAGPFRAALQRLPEKERETFINIVWPDIDPGVARLLARYPDETKVNGAQLTLPNSWNDAKTR